MEYCIMTKKGSIKLQQELKFLKTITRKKNVEDITNARLHGDLSENAEYKIAKENQFRTERKIRDIEYKLYNSRIIDPLTVQYKNRVVFSATVHLKNLDHKNNVVYQIVGQDEIDIENGLISYKSPIARALIGKNINDIISVHTPLGIRKYKLIKVEYI